MREWSNRELLTYLERVEPVLSELDHFELLDVAWDADAARVREAFHEMAAGLHPDRHRRSLTSEQYERLTIVYARIAEAYRVLRSDDHRKAYLEAQLRKAAPTSERSRAARPSVSPELSMLSPKAQQLYRRAQAALSTGDRASAALNLRMALRMHPHSDFLKQALQKTTKVD